MPDFDFQWKNLADEAIEYNQDRINELLNFTKIESAFFKNKQCLDAGCGNGRYTYALMKLGGIVDSIDISPQAISKCQKINPKARVQDLLTLSPNPIYDFVLSWGVIHHTSNPRMAFKNVASQVRPGGILHVMLYHQDTQTIYIKRRKIWQYLPHFCKRIYVKYLAFRFRGSEHGWWDALNPQYNFSYHESEIEKWFHEEGFENIRLVEKYNINMNGNKLKADIKELQNSNMGT